MKRGLALWKKKECKPADVAEIIKKQIAAARRLAPKKLA